MKKLLILVTAAACSAAGSRAADSKVDFAKDIQPILSQTCVKCHGPEKQKGKMRLDTKEAAFKGGKTGPALVAGDASKSELYRRINLPKTDDDFMPNEGEPLPKAQIELFRDWINQGANWPDTALTKSAGPSAPKGPALPADFKPSAAEQKAIAALAQKGVDVRPIAANLNWREANFRLQGTSVTDTVIAPLKDILGLVDLNLATTKITDAGLANLKGLTNLQRLHLELTGVTDAGLAQIKTLPNLTYLNLYGTKVTDSGLENLKGMKHLGNLYVWQSKVTEEGVKKLKTSLTNLDVSTGWDLTAFAKKEEKAEEKKEKSDNAADAKVEKKEAKAEKKEEKKAEEKKADDKKADDKKADDKKADDKKADDKKAEKQEEKK